MKNLSGLKFGRLFVKCLSNSKGYSNRRKYECICDCGKTCYILPTSLRTGNTISCGCYKKDFIKATKGKPYDLNSSEYRAWQNMKNRCFSPSNNQYHNYGERGITVCESWANSFENFLKDMGYKPTTNHSLDRVDNNQGYSKYNCQWATRNQQNFNKRTNIVFENGMTLPEFLDTFGVTYPQYKYLRYIKKLNNNQILKLKNNE